MKLKKKRIFKKIFGTVDKPRVSIFRSNKNIYAQAIDDQNHKTLVASSTLKLKKKKDYLNMSLCKTIGESLGQKLEQKQIKTIVFDKNGKPYHGRIASLADGIRTQGINF